MQKFPKKHQGKRERRRQREGVWGGEGRRNIRSETGSHATKNRSRCRSQFAQAAGQGRAGQEVCVPSTG